MGFGMKGRLVGIALRHGLTVLGGYLLAEGYADAAQIDAITGGALAVSGVVMSIWEKNTR